MRLMEFAVLYVLIGLGSSLGLLLVKRPLTAGTVMDAALLGAFWPLYGPFLIIQKGDRKPTSPRDPQVSPSLESLPLSSLLPDRETAAALEGRMELARSRSREIDRLLEAPELSYDAVFARHEELEASGDYRAAATARQRLQSIIRLRKMGDRFSTELTEISELLAQMRIQAEVVRLAGEDDGRETRELISELQLRLETLDEMLGEGDVTASAPTR